MSKIFKTYSFYCNDLNDIKYNLILDKAKQLLCFKNEISTDICSNPLEFLLLDKFSCITKYRTKLEYCNNQDISCAIEDVFVAYDNKRDAFVRNLKAVVQKDIVHTKYKVNTNNHKVGELKDYHIIVKSTNLTTVVSYLSKYYKGIETIDYIKNNKSTNPKQQKLRDLVLFYYNKFGERLINLCLAKQKRVIDNVFKHKIIFESLSFSSCTEQKQQIIKRNDEKGSIYGAVIVLSGQKVEKGKLYIPVKWSKKHHGSLEEYHKEANKKGQINVSYTVVFSKQQGGKNSIRICLTKPVDNNEIIGKDKYYGIDVNVKHNMFVDKDNNIIDYDRDMLNDYVSFLKKCDKKLSDKRINGEKIILSNKDKKVKDNWNVRIKDMLKVKSNLLVKQAIDLEHNHIVMEDLSMFGKSFGRSEEFEGFKYGRLVKMLNLSNLKNIVGSIANKKGLQFTVVQSCYTSSGCKCGCIDKRNRVEQENFKCISCGLEANADAHSAGMIEDRLLVDVLRESLLECKDGLYKPKSMKRETIKKILQECYDITAVNADI